MIVKILYRRNARRITARRCVGGDIRITVPYGFDVEKNRNIIDDLVERVLSATAKESDREPLFHDGYTLELDSLTFHINHVNKNQKTISATISQCSGHTTGHIHVPQTLDFNTLETEKRISDMMVRIVAKAGTRSILKRAEDVSRQIGVVPTEWKIGRGRRTLGTCHTDRSITLSAILAFLPTDLQEFVICHELAHLSEMNHSDRFHQLCNSYLDGREAELKQQLKKFKWPIRR